MKKAISDHLIRLQQQHGTLTPELVVQDAKNKASPLHDEFEWDVRKAAHQHWLDTGRALIREVKVEIVQDERVIRAPYFVRDPRLPHATQGYVATQSLRSDADLAREVVASECARVMQALQRAQQVADACGVREDVVALVNATAAVHTKVRSGATNKA